MAELLPIKDPYAAVWVATYDPLVVAWIGYQALEDLKARLIGRADAARPPESAHLPTLLRRPPRAPVSSEPPRREEREGRAGGRVATAERELRPRIASSALTPGTLPPQERRQRTARIAAILDDVSLSPDGLFTQLGEVGVPTVGGDTGPELSPIGIAHLYRQLFFDAGAGIGPIEQAVAVAPSETLEVVQEVTRRRVFETMEQFGSTETVQNEVAEESVNEIAEHVQSSVSNDMSFAASAHAEGSIGVMSGGGSASFDLSTSTERSQELTRRQVLTRTRRSAQVVQRSYSFSIRTLVDVADRSLLRRMLRNETDEPVNYALRRVMRRVRIKVQMVGPRLVWQMYLCRPGQALAVSRMVMFREAEPVSSPGLPPNAPPKPQPGTESGTQTVSIVSNTITLSLPLSSSRDIVAVSVDGLYDPSPEGKDPEAPALTGDPPEELPATGAKQYRFRVDAGTAQSASVNYTVHYEPSLTVLQDWEGQVAAARQQWESAQREAEFDRAKRLIEAKMRVRPRAAADLRLEERYEILNRLISEAFHHASPRGLPAPVEVELFHRYFDIPALFYFVHPSWWEPRYTHKRGEYEITDESEPAPLGASLGWLLQMDGDRRRNEFLNSPWVRVCIPFRPGLEREACEWLAKHVEGRRGFTLEPSSPLGALLAAIEARRARENLATPGPDYVTLDGEVAPDHTDAADAYPVIEEFELLQPTDGFVYEKITIVG